jgi:membrane dipeptidase
MIGTRAGGAQTGINMRKNTIVDMHCDTIHALRKRQQKGTPYSLRENDCHVDLRKLEKGGYLLQCFALFVDLNTVVDPWKEVLEELELFEKELLKNNDLAGLATSISDIAHIQKEGKISCLLSVEEGGVCRGDIEKLRMLYDRGVRMMTLTWNYENELGSPSLPRVRINGKETSQKTTQDISLKESRRLTLKGRAFVEEMERLGMLVDVSHLSDAGFADVVQMSKRPFVASHSNARALCAHPRNLTDDQIRALSEKGGVMGLNFYYDFLRRTKEKAQAFDTLSEIVAHAVHIIHVGGAEVLGLGSDFDGIDTPEVLTGADQIELLSDAFHKNGLSSSVIDKILHENVLRVFRDVLLYPVTH